MSTAEFHDHPMFDDEPLRNRAADLYSGEYADRIADLIVDMSEGPASAVVALVGPWGSCKTTLLNFVRLRDFVGLGAAVVGVGSCYEDSAGCVIVVVREPVSDAA